MEIKFNVTLVFTMEVVWCNCELEEMETVVRARLFKTEFNANPDD